MNRNNPLIFWHARKDGPQACRRFAPRCERAAAWFVDKDSLSIFHLQIHLLQLLLVP